MIKFPKIEDHQLVLVRALVNTGQVLDENFKIIINNKKQFYTIFDNISDVELYVKSIFKKRNDIEFWLYDCNNVMLKYYSPLEL